MEFDDEQRKELRTESHGIHIGHTVWIREDKDQCRRGRLLGSVMIKDYQEEAHCLGW